MIITYFRSSSFSDYLDYCQQKYFITYVLGHQDQPNIKAEKGTVTHKVLECLALMKLAIQEGKSYIKDDVLGDYTFVEKDLFKKTKVAPNIVKLINTQRSDEKMYLWDCLIPPTHHRLGGEIILDIFNQVYYYYSSRSSHKWSSKDKIDCWNWVWIVLDYHGGIYDPRLRTIYQPEQRFDISLDEDWAHYDFDVNGQKIEGQLCLKGTIDLVTQLDNNTLEVLDWKGLPIETKIPTPDGWTTMGDLQIGNLVFDENGIPTKVIGKSQPTQKPCYRIYFDDKTSVECDNEHLWKLHDGSVKKITELKVNDIIPCPKNLKCPLEYKTIIDIISIQNKITQCIMVDSIYHTYVCGDHIDNYIVTHNTGARKNWGTNEVKSFEKLQEDKQLMLYYFALSKLVPHDVLMTIFYIRDGGPFTMCFDETTIKKITNILKDTFNDVKKNEIPKLRDFYQKDRNCSWCTYYKTKFKGDTMNICSRIRDDIREKGMDYVLETHKNTSHDFHKYQAPGT